MEQKKLLWVVAAVSVFVLVIFGFALVIYSPPRTAETERQLASAVIPGQTAEIARRNAASVDPDSWVKNPDVTPGLDTEIVPSPQAESLTSINSAYGAREAEKPARTETSESASAPAATETISVRDLAARQAQEERPAKAQNATVAAAPTKAAKPEASSSKASAAPAKSEARPAIAKPKATANTAPARQTVVEYWIQTGSFSSKLNAESARKMLTERYLNAEIFTKEIDGAQTYRVRVGPYSDKEEADYWLGTITETPEFSGSYVSRVTAQR